MLIKKLIYDGGVNYNGEISFDRKNFIISKDNKAGKSTLLRVLLYALGFEIIMTNGIADLSLQTKVIVDNNHDNELYIKRIGNLVEYKSKKEKKQTFELPEARTKLLAKIFEFTNVDLVSNLLGAFYFEQGRGYSLINHGVVTPKNNFDLKSLINQLIPELEEKLNELETESEKISRQTKAIRAINKVIERFPDSLGEDDDETIIKNINMLKFKLKELKLKSKRIEEASKDNQSILQYIDKLGLKIRLKDGKEVSVTPNNIVGWKDITNYLKTESLIINNKILDTENELIRQQRLIDDRYSADVDFNKIKITIPQAFNIDKNKVRLKYLNSQSKKINSEKNLIFKKNDYQELQNRLYKLYTEFAELLNIKEWLKNGIFSSKNISGLLGTEQEFTAISIRLAALKLIEESTNVRLPIILDSPFQELTLNNQALLIELLNKRFSETHQIIITSVDEKIPKFINDWNIIELE